MILRTCFIVTVLVCKINGHPELTGRIVGGSPVDIALRPYQLSLQYHEAHVCGGSIINAKNGLTAAHCVIGKIVRYISIYAGSNFYNKGGVRRNVERAIAHSNYNDNTSQYDIAVIHFSAPITFNSKILPIALPLQNEPIPHASTATITGWGYVQEDLEALSPVLLQINVKIISRLRCNQFYRRVATVTTDMVCAGQKQGGKDACQGDSGGPCVANGKLVGLTSWGYGCARPGYPGVYTKVSNFINWINNNTKS